jgi:hypothetical protein
LRSLILFSAVLVSPFPSQCTAAPAPMQHPLQLLRQTRRPCTPTARVSPWCPTIDFVWALQQHLSMRSVAGAW